MIAPKAKSHRNQWRDEAERLRDEALLSRREWMAGQVAAGGQVTPPCQRPKTDGGPSPDQQYGREVVRLADAILAELEKEP
jgi:hypothetical protein